MRICSLAICFLSFATNPKSIRSEDSALRGRPLPSIEEKSPPILVTSDGDGKDVVAASVVAHGDAVEEEAPVTHEAQGLGGDMIDPTTFLETAPTLGKDGAEDGGESWMPKTDAGNIDEGGLFEGDIVPTVDWVMRAYGEDVVKELEEHGLLREPEEPPEEGSEIGLRGTVTSRLWRTRINDVVQVPYAFRSGHFSNSQRASIVRSMKGLESSGVVKFIQRTNQPHWVLIQDGGGCSSYVGRQVSQPQPLTLNRGGCLGKGTVQHEFLHALGFQHEQSRPDRDNFVKINYANIQPGKEFNFHKVHEVNSLGSPYDYGSVMHYSAKAFSKNGQNTINAPAAIGNRAGADATDITQVRLLYQCASGPRTFAQYKANRCTRDCKCWEGASGCNGNNDACQGSLVCSSNVCKKSGGGGGNRYALKTIHGTYVRAWPGGAGSKVDIQTYIGAWEKFSLVYLGNYRYAIKTAHGRYLRAWPGGAGSRLDVQTYIGPWEKFTFHNVGSGRYAIRSAHGTYLRAWPGGAGSRMDLQTYIGWWERFALVRA